MVCSTYSFIQADLNTFTIDFGNGFQWPVTNSENLKTSGLNLFD